MNGNNTGYISKRRRSINTGILWLLWRSSNCWPWRSQTLYFISMNILSFIWRNGRSPPLMHTKWWKITGVFCRCTTAKYSNLVVMAKNKLMKSSHLLCLSAKSVPSSKKSSMASSFMNSMTHMSLRMPIQFSSAKVVLF